MFSADEDSRLRSLVSQFGDTDWKRIASQMPGRTTRQCRERYKNYLSPDLSPRPWTQLEDDILAQKVIELGHKWAQMTGFFTGRSDVSLKNRWAALHGRSGRRMYPESPKLELKIETLHTETPTPASDLETNPVQPESEQPTFNIAELLWASTDPISILRDELNPETEHRFSMFPNYGGHIW
jgi:hypothetical protein